MLPSVLDYLEYDIPSLKGCLFREPCVGQKIRANPNFNAYYQAQAVCEACEWSDVLDQLTTPLPLTFKILSTQGIESRSLWNSFEKSLMEIVQRAESLSRQELGDDRYIALGAVAPQMQRVSGVWPEQDWTEIAAPRGSPWHMPSALRDSLLLGESMGVVRIQELASTLPVLIADEAVSIVLDLCAGPGSDSLGIMERSRQPNHTVLVANEVDTHRASSLCSRFQRHLCVAGRSIVTRMDAANFPHLRCAEPPRRFTEPHAEEPTTDDTANGPSCTSSHADELMHALRHYRCKRVQSIRIADSTNLWWGLRKARVDLVLTDVPCSADGMLRKRPELWSSWSVAHGLALFAKQLAILRRGLALVAQGGQVIYSTSTLDPVQNEAVVAAALHLHNMNETHPVHVECVKDKLPAELLSALRPGQQSWRVPAPAFADANPQLFSSWAEVPAELQAKAGGSLRPEMFPEFSGNIASECRNCIRVLPSKHINSSAFFAASIRKMGPASATRDKITFAPRTHNICRSATQNVNGLHPTKGCILKFYGLHADQDEAALRGVSRFPLERMALPPGSKDTILLLEEPRVGALQDQKDLNTLGGGAPLLHRVTGGASGAGKFFDGEPRGATFVWRPSAEGVDLLGRCCTRRLVALPLTLLKHFLLDRQIPLRQAAIPESCFVGCKMWGDNVRDSIVPGGVIVGLAAGTRAQLCRPPFFAALLSSHTLQLASKLDGDALRLHVDVLDEVSKQHDEFESSV